MKCRKCGQAGHFTKDCPGAAPPQQPPPPAAPPAQPAPAPTQCPVADKPMPLSQMGPSGVKCRKCGGTGHYTKDCPGGAPAPSTPSPAAPTPAPAAPAAPPKAAAPPKEEPKKEEPKIEEAPRCPEVTKEAAKEVLKALPKCRKCGEEGHFTKDCDTFQRQKQMAELQAKMEAQHKEKEEKRKADEAAAAAAAAEKRKAEEAAAAAAAEASAAEAAAAKAAAAEAGEGDDGDEDAASATPSSPASSKPKEPQIKPPTAEELAKMQEISRIAQEEMERLEKEKEAALKQLTVEEQVERYYSKSRPERRNLFKELAAASSFLIEADSLLMEMMANSVLDHTYGGQTLHIVFLVERLLHNIMSRGARYEVVFFDCHAAIWECNPLGALLREVLFCHLQHACETKVHCFPNYWCEEWETFLAETKPGFILSSDGEQARDVCGETMAAAVQFYYRAFMIHCVSVWHLHCVFTTRIVFRGLKADVWVIRGNSAHTTAVEGFYPGPDGVHEKVKGMLSPDNNQYIAQVNKGAASRQTALEDLLKTHADLFAEHGLPLVAVIGAAPELLSSTPEASPFVKAYILHVIVKGAVPLEWRAQKLSFAPPKCYSEFTSSLLQRMTPFVTAYRHHLEGTDADPAKALGLVDILDGRLLAQIAQFADRPQADLGLPADALAKAEAAWSLLSSDALLPLTKDPLGFQPLADTSDAEAAPHFLPGNQLSLDLGGINTKNMMRPVEWASNFQEDDYFEEWDLESEKGRKLDAMDDVTVKEEASTEESDYKKRRADERRRQFMASLLLKHATSLEGGTFLASGEILTAKEEDKDEKKKKDKEKEKEDKKKEKEDKKKEKEDKKKDKEDKKKKPEKESLKDKIKRENEAAQIAKLLEKETKRWKQFQSHLDKNPRKAIRQVNVDFLKKCEHQHVALEARLFLLRTRMQIWRDYCAEVTTNRSYIDACLVLIEIRDLCDKHKSILEKAQKTELVDTLLQMGLKDAAATIAKDLGVSLPSTPVQSSIDVGMSAARLQLEHMGHLLTRPVSDVEDSRVGFRPDLWQQRLLDVIDNNESALVCAPTSSGKTFISYYCMKKVLRTSDDGLVIFCAPNKQLAHQVKADVYAHFRSKTYKNPPWTLYGEYSNVWENVETCQILITAPEYLQTLLTNTKLYASISKRLQYLIVDEVHCIDELENGALWERMLMLTRCPFLALSATIGNINEFHGWLQRCQDVVKQHDEEEHKGKVKRNYTVHKVPDGEEVKEITRWSDLQKYIYIPQPPEERALWQECRPKISKQAFGEDTFHTIHPCACVTPAGLATTGFPGDLGFVPRESTALYGCMNNVSEADPALRKRLQGMEPDVYFKGLSHINQRKARDYEKLLKGEIQAWAQEPAMQKYCDQVLGKHRSQFLAALQKVQERGVCAHPMDSEDWLAEHLIHLVTSLAAEDKLPVLVFNFEETTCENLAEKVVDFLEAKENEYRSTPEFKKKMQDLAKRQKEAESRLKKHEKTMNNKKEEDAAEEDQICDLSDLGDLRERDVLPQFSFVRAHEGEGLDEEELADALRRVEKQYPKDHVLYRCLMRGIGFHHFGLPAAYRQAVEVLFRAKHIKCVLSTETMALGIHMPCRSVVFAGDHLQLNPLQFRQMSGRAGRRGFDMLGHVIFFGVPESKINRLMTSEIQSLKGHWPLTPALVHRLVTLYTHPGCKEKVRTRIQHQMSSLWLAPLITIGIPGDRLKKDNQEVILQRTVNQVQLYFSTVIDTLMQNGLLGSEGESYAFSDMANKLYRWDPDHFAFISLLKEGVLHQITEKYNPVTTHEKFTCAREHLEMRHSTNERCLESLLLVICHVLSRREIHRSVLADRDIDTESVHQVYLPRVDEQVAKAMESFHHRTMACFTAHVINAARLVNKEKQPTALPLSRLSFKNEEPSEPSGFLAEMETNSIKFEARSPFAALSGRGDVFDTQSEMIQSVRDGVHIDAEMIPCMELKDTSLASDGNLLMNADVFDYQHSSSQDDVLKWNGLNYKESWEDLDYFMRFMGRVEDIFTRLEKMMQSKGPGSPTTPAADGGDVTRTPLLMCLRDLLQRCQDSYSHADSKALTRQEKRKATTKLTAKKPKRPPLIKRDPRQNRRR